jgi:hypothetical protein
LYRYQPLRDKILGFIGILSGFASGALIPSIAIAMGKTLRSFDPRTS